MSYLSFSTHADQGRIERIIVLLLSCAFVVVLIAHKAQTIEAVKNPVLSFADHQQKMSTSAGLYATAALLSQDLTAVEADRVTRLRQQFVLAYLREKNFAGNIVLLDIRHNRIKLKDVLEIPLELADTDIGRLASLVKQIEQYYSERIRPV